MRSPVATLLLALTATPAVLCFLPEPAFSQEALPRITLKGGEGQSIAETGQILLLTKITDQRCPVGVDCYWEGLIRAEITVMPLKGPLQQIILCNLCDDGDRTATVEGLELTLIGLAPSQEDLAKLGRPAVQTDYALTLAYRPSAD
jgi:hypothetical protein